MALNIVGTGGDQDDSAYRYKMPPIIGKVEGRGNGIKTVIVNCASVAITLHRPTSHLCKYFGCELGAQTKWDTKLEKAIVNGAHDTAELQRLVHKYCDDFVLCPTCHYPETTLRIKSGKKEIWHVCKACGAKAMVDMTHKLCTFILKEAKAAKALKKKGGAKDGAKVKKDKKGKGAKMSDKEKAAEKAERKAEKKAKKKAKAIAAAAGNDNADENGIVWSTDFSDDAVKMRKIAEQARQAEQRNADEEEDEAEEVEKTAEQVLEDAVARVKSELANKATPETIKDVCINLQVAGCLPAADRIKIMYDAVMLECTTAAAFKQVITDNASYFEPLVSSLSGGPNAMLKAIELHFTDPKYAGLVPAVAVVLEALYDTEILTEETIVLWSQSASEADVMVVKAKAKPFIDWLGEAEESDSD